MRLDIGLVHRLGRVAPLDRDIGLAEASLDVALGKGDPLGNVRGVGRPGLDALGKEVVVQ